MAAFTATKSGYCKSFAAACASARILNNMDTVIPAVSIVIASVNAGICT